MMTRIIASATFLIMAALFVLGLIFWNTFRIEVGQDQCAVLIRKSGAALPPDQLVATQPGQRGIQEEVLGPGRYFRNPYTWDWEVKPLTNIPAGNPTTWEWIHSLEDKHHDQMRAGTFAFRGEFPKIGVVTRKVGSQPDIGEVIVDRASGKKGILREVLTPGVYKINPYIFEVDVHPATVIPAGFVGVVTNLFGEQPKKDYQPGLEELAPDAGELSTAPDGLVPTGPSVNTVQALAEPGQRGTLRNVLQPGMYFINPKLQKVTLIEVGYNEYSQIKISELENNQISFPSDTGFNIRLGVTVVWGVAPNHAAEMINEFGNIDGVLEKVIGPQLRSICRNIGSTFAARDFIQGEKREQFQRDLTAELQRVAHSKRIEVLLALVREIEVHSASGTAGGEVTDDLKRTIQESHVAIENKLTKEKQMEAATVQAQLEEAKKQVEIARETVKADTRLMVAQVGAEAQKKAARTDAEAQLEVATIMQQVAELEAKRVHILGEANADVEKMKNEAEAEGYRLLVQAFGSAKAYNLYTFAENFEPDSIRLIFAGEGTFWTDLTRFEEVGAATILEKNQTPTTPRP